VTVFPTARDEPYDVYSTVSFFKGSQPPLSTPAEKIELSNFLRGLGFIGTPLDETCDGHPLEVIPLFVTDNLESWRCKATSPRAASRRYEKKSLLGRRIITDSK
jgi:hypothetical protein